MSFDSATFYCVDCKEHKPISTGLTFEADGIRCKDCKK